VRDEKSAKKWIVRGSAILAIFFYGLASFSAWNHQHDARIHAEAALVESAPNFKAEIVT
jgi:hypothetical protein